MKKEVGVCYSRELEIIAPLRNNDRKTYSAAASYNKNNTDTLTQLHFSQLLGDMNLLNFLMLIIIFQSRSKLVMTKHRNLHTRACN